MLQWAEWLRKCVLGDRETVFVNLDETPMAKQMPARCGYVCNVNGTLDGDWHARIKARDTRSHATLMAAVCDDALLQRHLPQLLLTKDKKPSPELRKQHWRTWRYPSAGFQAARDG